MARNPSRPPPAAVHACERSCENAWKQLLPIVAWLLTRRRQSDRRALRLTFVAAGSYFVLFALLLAQALNGQSIAAPSPVFVTAFALWALATGIGVAVATRRQATASLRMMVNA